MGFETKIEWTDSTFNPWWGCNKVSEGCKNCYAERLDKRWDPNSNNWRNSFRFLSKEYWRKPLQWNEKCYKESKKRLIFCGSMCDWADLAAPKSEREKLWLTILVTKNLHWQLLTKRPESLNILLPKDWGEGYSNISLGVSIENQKTKHRINTLRQFNAKVKFLYCEPLLEPLGELDLTGIDWVICGGESGPGAREMSWESVFDLFAECKKQRVPFFFKQWGDVNKKNPPKIAGKIAEIKSFPLYYEKNGLR